jgi:hypothetical protein
MDQVTHLLDKLLDPIGRALTPDAARTILALRADVETQAQIDTLADRCNEGTLTPDERAQYESLVAAAGLIAVLQSKARAALASNPAA